MQVGLHYLFIVLLRIHQVVSNERRGAYEELLRELEARNNSVHVPPLPRSGPIPVEVSFQLHRVIRLISHSATLQVSGMIRVAWTDERLAWNSSVDPDHLLLPIRRVWVPELSLSTSAEFNLRPSSCCAEGMLLVLRRGRLVVERNIQVEVACAIDVHFFPQDLQHCSLSFLPAVTYRDIVQPIRADGYDTAPSRNIGEEWELLASTHRIEEESVFHPNGSRVRVSAYRLNLLLHRNHAFYFLTIIVPSLMLACVTLVPHLIPPSQCSPKLVIPVTTFLSFNIYMLLLERSLPKAETVPVLGQVYALLLATCTLTEVFQTVSVKLFMSQGNRVPRTLAFVYLRVLGTVCCLRRPRAAPAEAKDEPQADGPARAGGPDTAKLWVTMARVNDRLGLFISGVLVLCSFIYLFARCYSALEIPEEFRDAVKAAAPE